SIHQKSIPIGILLPNLLDQLWASPTSGLVYIPRHFDGGDIAKFARSDKIVCCPVVGSTPPLRSYLYDLLCSLYGFQGYFSIFQRFGKGFFDIDIPSRVNCFSTM